MILQGNSFHIPLRDNSVHCVITSPPYWGLRDYGIEEQLGLEKTPEEYVTNMVQVFREVWRVLRADGTLWLNMGDSYAGSGGPGSQYDNKSTAKFKDKFTKYVNPNRGDCGLKPKDLVGIPWHLAFALQADGCVDYKAVKLIEDIRNKILNKYDNQDIPSYVLTVLDTLDAEYHQAKGNSWYLRSDIIWGKPNPMPESVSGSRWERHKIKINDGPRTKTQWNQGKGQSIHCEPIWEDCLGCPECEKNDGLVLRMSAGRPTKSHEYIFLLTKSPAYFFDQEAIKERSIDPESLNGRRKRNDDKFVGQKFSDTRAGFSKIEEGKIYSTRNIRTVWEIATQPFSGAHFATFPQELVRRCLFAGTSEKGVCPKCGGPWVRMVDSKSIPTRPGYSTKREGMETEIQGVNKRFRLIPETKTLGWCPSCKCGEGIAIPATVLDPFFGAGTVGIVAQKYNRKFVGLELKWEYCQMATKRIKNENIAFI